MYVASLWGFTCVNKQGSQQEFCTTTSFFVLQFLLLRMEKKFALWWISQVSSCIIGKREFIIKELETPERFSDLDFQVSLPEKGEFSLTGTVFNLLFYLWALQDGWGSQIQISKCLAWTVFTRLADCARALCAQCGVAGTLASWSHSVTPKHHGHALSGP